MARPTAGHGSHDGGEREPCDWCGRPGESFEHDSWEDGELVWRDPSLCSVCGLIWDAEGNGEAFELLIESIERFEERVELFHAELKRRWRQKVAEGRRLLPSANEGPGVQVQEFRHD